MSKRDSAGLGGISCNCPDLGCLPASHPHAQGSRQQLFAANALKGQGWRFHTQFQAWFARQARAPAPQPFSPLLMLGPLQCGQS